MSESHYIVRGLGYGDEGKGSIVDFLTKYGEFEIVKEGGPNAAHHIISKDGKFHRSEQMGSGIFNKGVRTFCSKNMLIKPSNIIMENLRLYNIGIYDGIKRLSIDSRCTIVTPFHMMVGRLLEISRGKSRYGSTGMGVGQAVSDQKDNKILSLSDIADESILKQKVEDLFNEKFEHAECLVKNNPDNKELAEEYNYYSSVLSINTIFNSCYGFAQAYPQCINYNGEEYFNELLHSKKNLVFEGSQGILLDPEFGFKPYVTKISTTFSSTMELIAHRSCCIERIGVMRAYSTRHGPGPFVTEDKELTQIIPDTYNTTNAWQGEFRIGWVDLVATRYAISIDKDIDRKVDSIALTNLDRLSGLNHIKVCTGYEYIGDDEATVDKFFEWENSSIHKKTIKIIGFKQPKSTLSERVTDILFDCKPLYLIFEGWKKSIEQVKSFKGLPVEAKKYVNFLQSEDGLDTPISIISVGPTSKDKILSEDYWCIVNTSVE